ncbi:MAG TPA: GNAT family N-acetyltransferase [bacterium]|jgi:enamine deaminase RidA (YjgF/YER057c/UK114 family)/GNAT superfamily N-acetyltransferase|nr:GNAT family N-acetyltransferase [bacterium]
MRRKNVNTGSPWEQKIGYSRAVRVGTTIHVSATAGLDDAAAGIAKGDAFSQARRALSWIQGALFKAGSDAKDVVHTRIYLKRLEDWEAVARAHHEIFEKIKPATTIVQVLGFINPDILVEIEATAKVGVTERVDEDAMAVRISQAISDENVSLVRDLFEQYAQLRGYEFEDVNFEGEMASLPGVYGQAKGGRLLLATYEGEAAGVVGLKKIDAGMCEVKRLYVPPQYRGNGIGKMLVAEAVRQAKELGFKKVLADTDLNMRIAMVIFDEHGFKQTDQGHFELEFV